MTDARRVALVAACPFPTAQGSQVFIDQLARALTHAGHAVRLVTYGFGEYEARTPVPIHRTPAWVPSRRLRAGPSPWKPVLDALLAWRLYRVCRRHRIEVLHAVNYEAAATGALVGRLLGLPVVYHAHGLLELELPNYYSRRAARRLAALVGRWIEVRLLRAVQSVVALTAHDAARLRVLAPAALPITTVAPGVDVEGNGDGPIARPPAGVSGDPLFLYSGNLDGYQGWETVLHALALLADSLPGARLLVVTSSDPAPLRAEARRLGIDDRVDVRVGRPFAETVALARAADVALVPRPVPYGFPIKLLNYMALGVPVVVCDHGYAGVRDGETALVAAPTAASFAAAMLRLARDPALRARLAASARAVATSRYRWDEAARRIGEVYAALLPARPGRRSP
jgi:glycosyltransferase involved in cell wall biosynthesis